MRKYKLGELAISQTGPFGSQLHENDYVEKGIPIVTVEHLGDIGFTTQNLPFVSDKDAERLNKYRLKEGDIVFSRVGSIDRCVYVKKEQEGWLFSGRCLRVRCNSEEVNSRYLSYYFKLPEFKKMMLNISVGATMPSLNTDLMNSIQLVLLERNRQEQVAALLDALDSKIENNNEINAKLESMAKTIYDYWFLQFDFPDESGKPYKSSGGKMVWNEELKREIPEGWEVKPLKDIESNIITGKTPNTKDKTNYDGDIPFITIGDIRGNMHIAKTEQTLSRRGADSQSGKYIPSGSICVTCIASPGLVAFSTKTSQTNQQINSIVCDKDYNRLYLYFSIIDYFKYSSGAKTGNTFANMNKEDFSRIKLIYPSIEILERYSKRTKDIFEMILTDSKESQELIDLRNFLLPLLMNGQITFKSNS